MSNIPRIAVTPGEPAGIGPDIAIQIAQQAHLAELVVIADPELLEARAKQLNLPIAIKIFDPSQPAQPSTAGKLIVDPVSLPTHIEPGKANPQASGYVLNTLDRAIHLCREKQLSALVTGPINKHLINQYLQQCPGESAHTDDTFFSGHTEYLAQQTHTPKVVMMLAANPPSKQIKSLLTRPLRVALVTTHLPLKAVANAINYDNVKQTITILQHDLIHHFGISSPNILVCGLNPHAGENGDLGDEELTIIEPCLAELRAKGMRLSQALPADTLFTEKYLSGADAVVAMYHDQGLPVLKSHGFGRAVNITLGLPFIRTSVDHGTAFDLAGTGQASCGSLLAAIDMAIDLCQSL
tara:strand:- start:3986 stop:5044 length:1059 start_codon:yes stop_codon:yes gene_type:complete